MDEPNLLTEENVRGATWLETQKSKRRRRIRIIVAGTRKWRNRILFASTMDRMLSRFDPEDIELVSGDCPTGADALVKEYATANNIPIRLFPADWDSFPKIAGFMRNVEMANYATHLLLFWDGQSPGSAHMLKTAKTKNLIVKDFIVDINDTGT